MDLSVITASYNAADTIGQTIRSVDRLRRAANVEYLIVDGGSTDGTLDVIEAHEGAVDAWVSEPDQGIYDAMNKGIRRASGAWIGLLNSDDWYHEDAVAHLEETLRRVPNAKVVIGQLVLVTEPGTYGRVVDPPTFPYHCLKSNNHPATFVHRSVYEEVGVYDLAYPLAADLDFLLRAQAHPDVSLARCRRPLTYMRMEGASYGFRGMMESGRIEAKHFGLARGLWVWAVKTLRKSRRWVAHRVLPEPVFDRLRKAKWKRDAGDDHVIATIDEAGS
jgi:glycosyltransferase involved in cell wall biosynthesis